MTSRRPYWCPKTMKRRPCWCPKPVLWELNSFLMQRLSFVPINLHICWPREWKHSYRVSTVKSKRPSFLSADRLYGSFIHFLCCMCHVTYPKATYLVSIHGAGCSVIKNWEPFVCRPLLAIPTIPLLSCAMEKSSSEMEEKMNSKELQYSGWFFKKKRKQFGCTSHRS